MRKFEIPVIPPTTYKGIRFPDDLIEEIETAIKGKNSTFSAFVIASTRVALKEVNKKRRKKD